MKIGIFAYNFEHKKTQEGLLNLFLHGYEIDCILAADPVKLEFYQSKIRISPKGLKYTHPKEMAERLEIPYYVVRHNSEECRKIIKEHGLDLGIILGARILKQDIIDSFKIGVLNMHPGLLPQIRGLDTIKWAVLTNFKQGASCHLISKDVDKGWLILKEKVDVYEDDTLVDIFLRVQNKEQELMLKSLKILESGERNFEPVGEGNYFQAVPPKEEALLMEKFNEYKKRIIVI